MQVMNQFIRDHGGKVQTFLLVIAVFLSGFMFGNINTTSEAQVVPSYAIGDTDEAFEALWEAFNLIQNRYVDAGNVEVPELVDGAIQGMVDALGDQYSGYLTPEAYNMFNSDISGDISGIGVVIRQDEDTGEVEVLRVLDNAPAQGVGVLPGDIFWEVNGENVVGMTTSDLANLVRGPEGSDVRITFKRGEEFIDFTITRARFEIPNVETDILENDIAYISLAEFNSRSRTQLDAAIAELDVNSRSGFIFDLRGNPGGLLSSAVDIGSMFIEDGVLLYETFADGSEEIFEVNGNYADINVPIVVLIDESSASASELVAGAIKDTNAATLIGETSFGKGTVQTIQPLTNGGGLRITIARYLLPSRAWVHEVGVTPDIVIEWNPQTQEELEGPDIQLEAAIEYLNGLN